MADQAATAEPQFEPDLSFRKIKLATILTFTNLFASSLLAFGALTLVNVPMTTEFGWTQSEYSWATSAMLWCGAVAMPFYGHLIDKVGVRPIILLGSLGVGLCTLGMAYISGALWQFYLLFGLLGMFGATAMAYTKVLGALFTQHRGKALALLGVESTLAAATLPPLLNWLIIDYGWRTMFIVCGCVILALIPLVYHTLDEPGEIGSDRRLFKGKQPRTAAVEPPRANLPGLTGAEVLRNRVYWLIVLATVLATAPRTGMMPFLVPMLQEKGFSQGDAAAYMSISALIAPAGTLAAGWALDRFNTSRVAVPFKMVSVAGMFTFMMVTASFGAWPLLMVAVGFTGFAFGTARPIGSYLHIRFFGLKAFGFYFGLENSILAVMMGAAPPIVAAMRDSSGDYTSSYLAMLVTLALAAGLYWIMGPYRYPANIGAVPIQPKGERETAPREARPPTPAVAASGAA